jgi:hypothetical protein
VIIKKGDKIKTIDLTYHERVEEMSFTLKLKASFTVFDFSEQEITDDDDDFF